MRILFLIITFGLFTNITAQEAVEKSSSSSWMIQQQKQLKLKTDLNKGADKTSILQINNQSDAGIQLPPLYQPHLAFFCRIEKDLSTFFDMGIDIGVK